MQTTTTNINRTERRKYKLTPYLLKNMKTAKIFKDNTNYINSIDFFRDGEVLVTSSLDESIHLYNVNSGQQEKQVLSKKYGVDLIRFTHSRDCVLAASKNDWDHTLRYLSLHDNKYLRYFRGHRGSVVSLSMSPINDGFLSASLDGTVRLWDLRSAKCEGMLRRTSPQLSAVFDPSGLIFAVAMSNNTVKQYDSRKYDGGAFLSFQVDFHKELAWTHAEFSPDGKHLLLSTTDSVIFLMDSYNGHLVQTYHLSDTASTDAASSTSHQVNKQDAILSASFSPDSKYVIAGTQQGSIIVWDKLTSELISKWTGHAGAVGALQWNPKMCMVASACTNLHWWIPSSLEENQSMVDDLD